MNKEINQKISQLLDDELSHSEQGRVLQDISQQPESLNKFNRYNLVSHALKTNEVVKIKPDFLSQINQQLEKEPHYLLPVQKSKQRDKSQTVQRGNKSSVINWQKASIAVAASVAIVSVVLTQKLNTSDGTQQPEIALAGVGQRVVMEESPKLKVVSTTKTPEKSKEYAAMQHERLKAYLRAHSGDMYTHGSVTAQPYARVANH